MRRRASLATESADRRVNNLAEHRSTESEAGRSQTGLDVESRFTEGRISAVLSPHLFLAPPDYPIRARQRGTPVPRRRRCFHDRAARSAAVTPRRGFRLSCVSTGGARGQRAHGARGAPAGAAGTMVARTRRNAPNAPCAADRARRTVRAWARASS